jgi:16S rRNA (guanine966-N2)-methyltransferase
MSSPRIIAGKARGIRLQDVPGDITRPITDRVKEALFNIIGADILDADFLDLFGGTGSVGIEALSRGARFVRFIDLNRPAVNVIKANLQLTHLEGQAQVLGQDAFTHLKQPADRKFDYIYVAPPQYKGLWERALNEIDKNPAWMVPDGWVIAQIDPVEYGELKLANLHEFEQRRYGSTLLVFYEPAT